MRLLRIVPVLAFASAAGCGLIDLGERTSVVEIYGMHSGTPDGPVVPDYGLVENPRNFTTPDGWDIELFQGYLTTTALQLVSCDGSHAATFEMLFGACAEDFIRVADSSPIPMGLVDTEDASYCTLVVQFGNYYPLPPDDPAHDPPESEEISDGATYHVLARASKEGFEDVDIEVTSDSVFEVALDISAFANGGPLVLDEEPVEYQLTVAKLYDRWFAEMDFENGSQSDHEAALREGIQNGLRPLVGFTY